jgi:predicted RNase H-like HicB family nuclease
MNESAKYLKIVEWSDEDQCFVGQCPGIIGPCCHGDDEKKVYSELCEIVDEWLAIWKKEGKALPRPTYGRGIAQRIAEAA